MPAGAVICARPLVAERNPGLGIFETFNDVGLAVKNATGGRQQPWLATSPIEGSFQFIPKQVSNIAAISQTGTALTNTTQTVDPIAIELAFWNSIKDSLDPSDLRAYLDQFPNGKFSTIARNRLRGAQVANVAPSALTNAPPTSVPATPSPAPNIHIGTLRKIKNTGSITIGHRDASIPFSYFDDKRKPIGYAIDLCEKVVDAIKVELDMPRLEVKYQLVTSTNRIPLIANSTIDLECGATTNSQARQKEVAFTITHFLTMNRYVFKKTSSINSIGDLKGKTIVSTSGTTNLKQLTEFNMARNMGMTIVPAYGHPEAFQMVETGRAAAFVMDDIILYTLIAQSRTPNDYVISSDALSLPEPYGIMLRKDDLEFKKFVDDVIAAVYKSGEIINIYEKWFMRPVPPKGIIYNIRNYSALRYCTFGRNARYFRSWMKYLTCQHLA